jgi:hypothetical protein
MKKMLVIASVVMVLGWSAQAASYLVVGNALYSGVTVGECGVNADGIYTMYLTGGNLPGPQWVALDMSSSHGKSMLAVFLTAMATEKTVLIRAQPIAESQQDGYGVCEVTLVTLSSN